MAVVLLGGGLDAYDKMDAVLAAASAIVFPKVPEPIFFGDGSIQHVLVAPKQIPNLTAAAKKAGMYVLTDRFGAQRQGPLQPGKRFII